MNLQNKPTVEEILSKLDTSWLNKDEVEAVGKIIKGMINSGIEKEQIESFSLETLLDISKRGKKIKKEIREETSIAFFADVLYEQVWDEDRGGRFAYLDDDKVSYLPSIGELYPIESEAILSGVVKLPSGAEEYESTTKLMEDLKNHIIKYLDVDDTFLRYAVYYIMLTWIYDKLHTVPYLRVLGDTGSGKTRFLNTIGNLCYKPITTSGTVTPAPIYRLQQVWKGTLILDEADRKQSDAADEIIKILNCGFEKGTPVIRCNPDKKNEVESHIVFGPKIISTRYRFYDKALESRCITHTIKETTRNDIPPSLTPVFHEEQEKLRRQLLMFRLKTYGDIDPNMTDDFELLKTIQVEPRLKQTFAPFLVMLKDEDIRKEFLEFILEYSKEIIDERSDSFEGMVVLTVKELKVEEQEYITSGDIAERMNQKFKFKKEVGSRGVGRILKSLGLRTKNTRMTAGVKKSIVWDPDAKNLWDTILRRYDPDYDENSGNPESVVVEESHI